MIGQRVFHTNFTTVTKKIRIAQETVLGVAGIRILQKVGYNFDVVHMNEGHALPAAF